MSIHDILLAHAAVTLAIAGATWAIQLTIIPVLERDAEATWNRHAGIYRNAVRTLLWPLLVIEGGTGLVAAVTRPPGIPAWMHGVNLFLLLCAWTTIPVVRSLIGHSPLSRYDPAGFRRFARLNWIRVAVWTMRASVVIVMLRLAVLAARAA